MGVKQHSSSNSGMNTMQVHYCTKITNKLYNYPISDSFRQPVNPDEDGCNDYFDRIKRPMDLGTVLQNLSENKYQSIDQWKNDVNQIWKNAMTYNDPSSPIYIIALDLSETFKKMAESIPKTPTEEWVRKLRKEHAKLQRLFKLKKNSV